MTLALLLAWACMGPAQASEWGPWNGSWAPVDGVEAAPPKPEPRHGLLEAAYRVYRDQISPRDGARCPYYPTCSAYGILSVREHGTLVGSLLTLDRLLREYPWMEQFDHYPIVTPHKTPRLLDPVPARP